MPVIETHKLEPDKPHPQLQQIYNGLDTAVTLEIFEELQTLFNIEPEIYNFERALQAPALEMMMRGFRIDEYERQKGISLLREKLTYLREMLNEFAIAVWDKPLNPSGSAHQAMKDFFYGAMKLPEQWISQKGVRKLSMNRETLEKLEIYFHARPIIATILACRDIKKKLEVLETEIDFDGRMRTSYNIAGTETTRWSSSKNAEGRGCVLPSTEVLTPSGWRAISSIQDGEIIAQYVLGGRIEFVPCTIFKTQFDGALQHCETEQFQATLTPAHRVLHFGPAANTILTETAFGVSRRSQTHIPLGGKFNGGDLSYPAYLSMLMADFSKEPSGWRGAFKKERKINRFLHLAKMYNIRYTEQNDNRAGYRKFYIPYTDENRFMPKKWGSWILQLTPTSACELLEEARYWDSHDRSSGYIFYSADKEQAEWFATLAHLAERSATLRVMEQSAGSYSTSTIWCVNVKTRRHGQIKRKHWSFIQYSGDVYCPQIPSSYWLMRENGFISVTGNTNLQNITQELRRMFLADEGYKLCGIDLEQAESREVGWLHGTLFGDWRYLDACYAGDLHTLTAKMVWPELPWTGNAKEDRAIADQDFYRGMFSYRDMSKRGGHLTNYYGTAWTASRHLKVPLKMMEDFQAKYALGAECAYPAFGKWWRYVAQQIQTTQSLTTPFNTTRHFFGRLNDDTTLREAIAFSPQASTALRMNLGLWRIWKHMGTRVQLIAQVHDAIYFQMREDDDHAAIIAQALELINVPLQHGDHTLIVPGEAKVGWNWGSFEPKSKKEWEKNNVNGLVKWKGTDTRKREGRVM